jgi:hypothetical protein
MCAAAREPKNTNLSNIVPLTSRTNERSDAGSSENGPAVFAPKAQREALSTPPLSTTPLLRSEPPWKLPGQPGAFTDDVAVGQPIGRISPKTVIVVEPPDPPRRNSGATRWLIGVALIAGGVGGYVWGYTPRAIAPQRSPAVADAERANLTTGQIGSPQAAPTRRSTPRLMVEAVRLWRTDELALLTISCAGADVDDSVLINGLAPGSVLVSGVPEAANAWRLMSMDLNYAVIRPPRGFVGVMNLTLELRLANDTVVDRKGLQLEWTGVSALAPTASGEPSQPHLEASEIALLTKRGAEYVANGNIGAARMMFRPAAEAGDAAAAFALAETYDPSVLEKRGAKGIAPDMAQAQRWYDKARALGSTATPGQLVGITR